MTEAHSTDLMSETDLSDDLDSFVSLAMATADLIWAASDHDGIGADSIGKVAYNLSSEAFQLRGRLDRRLEERMEQIYKERPELPSSVGVSRGGRNFTAARIEPMVKTNSMMTMGRSKKLKPYT